MALALNRTFENEEICLEHCKKLANLKPGDEVFIDGWRKAIFLSFNEGMRINAMYYNEDKEIGLVGAAPGCVTFEKVITREEAKEELGRRLGDRLK